MSLETITDSKGNTLSLVIQVPSYGYEMQLKSKDGISVFFDLTGENLKLLAETLASASAFAEKYGR